LASITSQWCSQSVNQQSPSWTPGSGLRTKTINLL
jgi:hypothetical protein